MTSLERQLEEELIKKLRNLKYQYREDIRDRTALEQNFRRKFDELNHVRLTDGEFQRLLDEITTPDVFTASHKELGDLENERKAIDEKGVALRAEMSTQLEGVGLAIDLAEFEQVDAKIAELRGSLSRLEQQRELEQKRDGLEKNLASIKVSHEAAGRNADRLEQLAETEMADKRETFSAKYSELLRETIKDCRYASIDADYVPLINAGEYKEASSNVPRRLMYYATLLHLAKNYPDVRFPRFLLVDTPDTAGIDPANLIGSLEEVVKVVEEEGATCQVILTTGEGQNPEDSADNVFATLTLENRLLQRKPNAK